MNAYSVFFRSTFTLSFIALTLAISANAHSPDSFRASTGDLGEGLYAVPSVSEPQLISVCDGHIIPLLPPLPVPDFIIKNGLVGSFARQEFGGKLTYVVIGEKGVTAASAAFLGQAIVADEGHGGRFCVRQSYTVSKDKAELVVQLIDKINMFNPMVFLTRRIKIHTTGKDAGRVVYSIRDSRDDHPGLHYGASVGSGVGILFREGGSSSGDKDLVRLKN